MKLMTITDWEKLSLKIIALFATAMLISYSPQFLRGFFNDSLYPTTYGFHNDIIDADWNWGFRHYLYLIMNILLFIVQITRIIKWVDKRSSNDKNCFPV